MKPTPVARSAPRRHQRGIDALGRIEVRCDAGELVGADDRQQRQLGAESRRGHGLVGALAARAHVEIPAEHRFPEDRQFRRPDRQADGEAADNGDRRSGHRLRSGRHGRSQDRLFIDGRARQLPVNRPPRSTSTRSALRISSGISDEISTIATPSEAIPRRIA